MLSSLGRSHSCSWNGEGGGHRTGLSSSGPSPTHVRAPLCFPPARRATEGPWQGKHVLSLIKTRHPECWPGAQGKLRRAGHQFDTHTTPPVTPTSPGAFDRVQCTNQQPQTPPASELRRTRVTNAWSHSPSSVTGPCSTRTGPDLWPSDVTWCRVGARPRAAARPPRPQFLRFRQQKYLLFGDPNSTQKLKKNYNPC